MGAHSSPRTNCSGFGFAAPQLAVEIGPTGNPDCNNCFISEIPARPRTASCVAGFRALTRSNVSCGSGSYFRQNRFVTSSRALRIGIYGLPEPECRSRINPAATVAAPVSIHPVPVQSTANRSDGPRCEICAEPFDDDKSYACDECLFRLCGPCFDDHLREGHWSDSLSTAEMLHSSRSGLIANPLSLNQEAQHTPTSFSASRSSGGSK